MKFIQKIRDSIHWFFHGTDSGYVRMVVYGVIGIMIVIWVIFKLFTSWLQMIFGG